MTLSWERKPQWQDARIPFLGILIVYLILGVTVLGFNRSLIQILSTIVFACVLDMVLHYVLRRRALLFPLSAAITGASLSILVNYAHGLWYPLLPVFFAIASKYAITYQGRHVFNPSLFGIVLCLWFSDGMISAAPAYQWGGSLAVAIFVVTAALVLFVFRIKRTTLIVSFLLFYFIALAYRAWLTRWHMPPETWYLGALTSPAFYLFAFFMITDPASSPPGRAAQIIMAFVIVVLDLVLHKVQVYSTLFYAGFSYFALRFAWLHVRALVKAHGQWLQSLLSTLLNSLYRSVSLTGVAIAMVMVYRSGAVPATHSTVDFYLEEVNAADAGIRSRPGDILERVDSRLQHIAKWILSVGDAVAVNDVNQDGLMDVFLTNSMKHQEDRAALYLNKGDFSFERVPLPDLVPLTTKPEQQGLPSGALWFDYDNDADDDLLLLVSFGQPRLLKSLWRETGRVEFVDVSGQQGLTDYVIGVAANVLDINSDARLDLMIGNTMALDLPGYNEPVPLNVFSLPQPAYPGDRRMLNIMHRTWHNADNGGENYVYLHQGQRFERQDSRKMGLYERRWTLDIGTGDLNGDGRPDIYIANDFGPDSLYINQGDLRFSKVSGALIGSISRDTYKGMNASLADVDNNGYLDIYVSNVHEKLQAEGSLLWMNDGSVDQNGAAAFTDEAVRRNVLNEKRFGWGAAVGDLDLDGRLDLVQANGMVDDAYDKQHQQCPDFWYWNAAIGLTGPDVHGYADRWATLSGRCIFPYESSRVYHNQGGVFVDIAEQVGMGRKGNARGVALVDLDNDGDLDVLLTRQFAPLSIYRNQARNKVNNTANNKAWIGLELEGNGSTCNKNAIGTRVQLQGSKGGKQYREKQASNGFSAQGDGRLLFGLGYLTKNGAPSENTVSVKVSWCGQVPAQSYQLQTGRYHRLQQTPGSLNGAAGVINHADAEAGES